MSGARCVPMPKGTVITVLEAAEMAGVSDDTVRRRAREYGLGTQPGGKGKWRISYPAWSAHLADDPVALKAIRLGRFDDPSVKPYLAGRFGAGARN